MSKFQRNRAGTAYVSRQDGSLLYQCQYCATWFEPKTKFKQKFCSESCRTMACRERKNGLGGTLAKKRDFTSNYVLAKRIEALEAKNEKSLEYMYGKLLERQHDNDLRLREEIMKLNAGMSAIKKQMDWLMLIAAIAPVVSPAVVTWFKEVALGEKPPTDEIKDDLEAIRDRLDEQTRLQLKKLLEEKKLEEIASLFGV